MYKVYNSYVNEYPSVHVYTVYKILVVYYSLIYYMYIIKS